MNKPILTNSGLVNFKKATFTAYASELQHAGHEFSDTVVLHNPKTGGSTSFTLTDIKGDNEGDIQAWEFSSGAPLNLKLIVFNT